MSFSEAKIQILKERLSTYYTTTEVDSLLSDKADTADIPVLAQSSIDESTAIDKTGVTDTSKFPLLNGVGNDTLVHIAYADLKLLLKDYFDTLYTPL